MKKQKTYLTLLHSERPKLYTILAFLSAIGLIYKPTSEGPKDYFLLMCMTTISGEVTMPFSFLPPFSTGANS